MRAAINQCITELYEMKYKVTKMAGVFMAILKHIASKNADYGEVVVFDFSI